MFINDLGLVTFTDSTANVQDISLDMHLKITNLKLQPHLSEADELNH